MQEDVYGVFFRDGHQEYLRAAFDTEEEAEKQSYDLAVLEYHVTLEDYDEGERNDEPDWSRYEGKYYVEPIARDLVDFTRLERGFAQLIS